MAVNTERSMNHDFNQGVVDHTIRLAQGQDRGGQADQANYYNNLVGGGLMTGEHLTQDYLVGLVANPYH